MIEIKKSVVLTPAEKEEAETFILTRKATYTHPHLEEDRSALDEARIGVWKERLTESQAYLVWEAARWALERTYMYPFCSKSRLERIKNIQDKILKEFQAP